MKYLIVELTCAAILNALPVLIISFITMKEDEDRVEYREMADKEILDQK